MTLETITGKVEDEQWRKYVIKKLHHLYKSDQIEAFVFSLTMFESFFPQSRCFHAIQNVPLQKYGISNYQHIQIPTRDGLKLDAWFFPVQQPKATILVLHGSGYNMADHSLPCSQFLLDCQYQLLLFNARYWNYAEKPQEYIGYIGNDLNDIEDIITWITKQGEVKMDINKMGIFGLSYGGYKTGLIASRVKEFKVAIMDAPAVAPFLDPFNEEQKNTIIKSVHDRIKDRYGFDLLSGQFNIFTQIKKAAPKPLLFLHGEKDKIIPMENTRKLYELSTGSKEFYTFPHSGHCEAMFTGDKEKYVSLVLAFLKKYLN